jgi:hypothetical protein
MKNLLVKAFALTGLLLVAVSSQAANDKQVWLETSRTGMEAFMTAVQNAGYIDDEGKITSSGIGYAGQFAVGTDLVTQILPQSVLSLEPALRNEPVGRLLFIYNGLYSADGSVRESITVAEFAVIAQGVGWFVPVEKGLFQQLVSLDQALAGINARATSGKMVSSEIDNITQYLEKLTGRNLSGQIDPAQIAAMNDRIHRVEDGQWTLAMRKAAQKEALAATAPVVRQLKEADAALLKQNAELKARLQAAEESLSMQRSLAEANARDVDLTNTQVGDNTAKLAELEKTIQTVDGNVGLLEQAGETSQSRVLLGWVIIAVLLIALFAWLLVLSRRRDQAALRQTKPAVPSIGDKVKSGDVQTDKPSSSVPERESFDVRDYLKDMRADRKTASPSQGKAA